MRPSDAALVKHALNGNQRAFGKLVDRYKGLVFAIILNRVHDFEVAQDLSQDTFIEAYMKLQNLKDHLKFSSWLYGIASNMSLKWLKRSRPTVSVEQVLEKQGIGEESGVNILLEDLETPETLYEEQELKDAVWSALNAIPERNREVVILYYMEDLSKKEIAEFLSLSVGAVRGRLDRGREALRRRLIDLDMFEDVLRERKPDRGFTRRVMVALPTLGVGASKFSMMWVVGWLSYVLISVAVVSFVGLGLWLGGVFGVGKMGRGGYGNTGTSSGIKVRLMPGGESGSEIGTEQFAAPAKAPDALDLQLGLEETSVGDVLKLDHLGDDLLGEVAQDKGSYEGQADSLPSKKRAVKVSSSMLPTLGVEVRLTDDDIFVWYVNRSEGMGDLRRALTDEERNVLLMEVKNRIISALHSSSVFGRVEEMEVLKGYSGSVDYLLSIVLEKRRYYSGEGDPLYIGSRGQYYIPGGVASSGVFLKATLTDLDDNEALWSISGTAFDFETSGNLVSPYLNPLRYHEYKQQLQYIVHKICAEVISTVASDVSGRSHPQFSFRRR